MTPTTPTRHRSLGVVVVSAIGLALVPNTADATDPSSSSVFDLAFAVRELTEDVVDQTSAAPSYGTCPDCQTVALAFQLLLVYGDPAAAPAADRRLLGEGCAECLTFASATQLVIGGPDPGLLNEDETLRLAELRQRLHTLDDRVAALTPEEVTAEVAAVESELRSIYSTPLGPGSTVDGRREEDAGEDSGPTEPVSTSAAVSTTVALPSTDPDVEVPVSSTTTEAPSPTTSTSSTTIPPTSSVEPVITTSTSAP